MQELANLRCSQHFAPYQACICLHAFSPAYRPLGTTASPDETGVEPFLERDLLNRRSVRYWVLNFAHVPRCPLDAAERDRKSYIPVLSVGPGSSVPDQLCLSGEVLDEPASRAMDPPSGLPLGLDLSATYDTIAFHLAVGDRLTFYSDGLLEARNAGGEMFSFGRMRALVATQPDAKQMAASAIAVGQDDDITVLTPRLPSGAKSTTLLTAPEMSIATA
jgi:hypothetical protein